MDSKETMTLGFGQNEMKKDACGGGGGGSIFLSGAGAGQKVRAIITADADTYVNIL